MKFFIFESKNIHPKAIKLLKDKGFSVQTETSGTGNKNEIGAIVVKSQTQVTPSLLDEFPKLKYVIRAGVGIENINKEACDKRGIKIINSPGSNANSVSELVICFMLLLNRRITYQINLLKKGGWRNKEYIGSELTNKTIGLLGCGAVGKLVTDKLQKFGVKEILAYDPYLDKKTLKERYARKCELDEVLKKSDIISLHLPLTPETNQLINKQKLALLKKGAYLINTSRGKIINEKDLIEALSNGHLGGIAMDVFENEPNIRKEFMELPNVIATPHIGAFSNESLENSGVQAIENFLKIYNNQ